MSSLFITLFFLLKITQAEHLKQLEKCEGCLPSIFMQNGLYGYPCPLPQQNIAAQSRLAQHLIPMRRGYIDPLSACPDCITPHKISALTGGRPQKQDIEIDINKGIFNIKFKFYFWIKIL